jgi:hypothetical protein
VGDVSLRFFARPNRVPPQRIEANTLPLRLGARFRYRENVRCNHTYGDIQHETFARAIHNFIILRGCAYGVCAI